MNPIPNPSLCTGEEPWLRLSRRECLNRLALGLGGIALAELLGRGVAQAAPAATAGAVRPPLHFPAKAKRIIYLFQSGGPSQLDLFDHKPLLNQRHGEQLPDAVRGSQRLTGMSGNQSSIPIAGSPFKFQQHGQSGAWMSELLPHTARVADDLCIVRSMYTESINHGPGVTFMQTGSQIPGRPSFGSWLDYGLGSDNENLPSFVVLITKDKKGQPLMSHLWGSGFLPAKHQAVRFRSGGDPVLYLGNPAGVAPENRRLALDRLRELHEHQFAGTPDAEISARIANYEMAFAMQTSVPEVTNLKDEPESIFAEYGEEARQPGTFAANCLLARRLAERGVKFIQLYHQDWDHHGGLPGAIKRECQQTDRATAALITDLKRRGMLDDTLVVWGGEFGRTNYCQGLLKAGNFGRDHHPRCFTIWMAGGGVKPGLTFGETDEYGYNITKDPVHIHDLHATILHLFGIDHERLTYKFQGRRYRLTDVHGKVVKDVIA
ncbi:DUF1501 domain-containing protein [Horticoccus sp. 23ND18S-11]|uniref:DUF1501 domain-containing protein n=1 Tax=Horticoccus sp. 23ND18S-11 TaxID=3391832 RepID=UPI0039C953D0